jgi:hypothetical protein
MADPLDIRRRRESALSQRDDAEQDEADFLMERLRYGANLITDDAANRTQATRESARLRGDNVDGSVLPPIGGQSAPLPETFGDELVGRLGQSEDPAAMELLRADSDRLDAGRSAVPRRAPVAPQRAAQPPLGMPALPRPTPRSGAPVDVPEGDWLGFGDVPGTSAPTGVPSSRGAGARALQVMQGGGAKRITPMDSARIRAGSARQAAGRPALPFNPPADAAEATTRRAEAVTRFAENDARRAQGARDTATRAMASVADYPMATSAMGNVFDGFSQGFGDEALGLVDMLRGENYEQSRDTYRNMIDQATEMSPLVGFGSRMAGAIGSGLVAPAAAAPRALTLGGAMARGAASGAAAGGISGIGESEADDWRSLLSDAGQSAAIGGVFGGALGGAGHGISRAADWVAGQADDVARQANPLRARASGVRTVGMQRLVDDLPGGMDEFAGDVRRLGISPEGSIHTPEVAGARAQEIAGASGQRIRDLIVEMGRHESAAGISPGVTGLADDAATAAGRPGARVNPMASTEAGAYRVAAPRGSVSPDRILSELDRVIREADGVPGAESRLQAARELSDELRSGGPISFERAQRIKREWDSLINWNASASPTSRLTPLESQRRSLRTALQGAMDEAVESRLGADRMAGYRGDRRDFQVSHLVDRLAHDNELREAANRLVGPSDYGAAIAASANGGGIGRALLSAIANRVMRTREASAAATALERGSQRMRGAPERAAQQIGRARAIGLPTVARASADLTATDRAAPQAPQAPIQVSDDEWAEIAGDEPAEPTNEPTQVSQEEWDLLFGEQ